MIVALPSSRASQAPAEPPTGPDLLAPVRDILGAWWRTDRLTLLGVVIVTLLASVSTVAAPWVFSRLIDRMAQQGEIAVGLVWAFTGYAVLLGFATALQRIVQYLGFMSSRSLDYIAATRFFERILAKSAAFFVERNPTEIQTASEQGRGAMGMLAQLGLNAAIPGVVQIGLTVLTLWTLIRFDVAAIVLVFGVFSITLTLIAARRTQPYLERATEASQVNARFVGNAMGAMETLRHFGSQGWIQGRFEARAREVRDNWRGYVLRHLGFLVMVGLGLAIQFAVTMGLLVPLHQAGQITIGDIVLFNTLLLQLNMPFEMIAHLINELARARAALRPFATLWAAPEERRPAGTAPLALTDGRLEFDSVGLRYPNGRGVADVSFSARRGGITFLVGATGAGKSTVFRLALKSIEPDTGRIVVDGIELSTVPRPDWAARVAVVPQEAVLLNESLAENILLGRPRDDERLRAATRQAAVLAFIEALPDGFETTVGERGMKLSGGERQRIAIARALYGEPAILLLDEASSALDEATEGDIMDHVRALAGTVTVLAITHRRSVISAGDSVVDLSA